MLKTNYYFFVDKWCMDIASIHCYYKEMLHGTKSVFFSADKWFMDIVTIRK